MKKLLLISLLLVGCGLFVKKQTPPTSVAANVETTTPVPVPPPQSWLDTVTTIDTTLHIDTVFHFDTVLKVVKIGTPPAPIPAFVASCSARLVCRFDGSKSFIPAGGLAYSWYFGDGSAAGGLIIPSKTFRLPGHYFVRFAVTDSLRRSAQVGDTIVVGQPDSVIAMKILPESLTVVVGTKGQLCAFIQTADGFWHPDSLSYAHSECQTEGKTLKPFSVSFLHVNIPPILLREAMSKVRINTVASNE